MKTVYFPEKIADQFCDLAHANTVINKETIGLLCGLLNENGYYEVTHVIVPDQDGQSDSCNVTSVGEGQLSRILNEHSIIQLGWIHTHPSWDVFLSSVDLHNQYNIQCLLDEAFAMVVKPSVTTSSGNVVAHMGIFHLSKYGFDNIKKCKQSGFHRHDNVHLLYQTAKHCKPASQSTAQVINFTQLSEQPTQRNWIVCEPRNTTVSACYDSQPSTSASTSGNVQPSYAQVVKNRNWHLPEFDHQYVDRRMVSDLDSKTINMLERCQEFVDVEYMCSLQVSGAATGDTSLRTDLIGLEKAIINACSGDLVSTVCYIATFCVTAANQKYIYSRWAESKDLQGFVKGQLNTLQHSMPQDADHYIAWQVSSCHDLNERQKEYESDRSLKFQGTNKAVKSTGHRWNQTVKGTNSNKKSVERCHSRLASNHNIPSVQLLGTAVHIYKKHKEKVLSRHEHTDGYHVQTGVYEQVDFVRGIQDFKINGIARKPKTFQEHTADFNNSTIDFELQQEILNSLSNNVRGGAGVSYESHFSLGKCNDTGAVSTLKYYPSSVRNKVLYFCHQRDFRSAAKVVSEGIPQGTKRVAPSAEYHTCSRTARQSSPSPSGLEDFHPLHQVDPRHSQYLAFVENIVSSGELMWRIHSDKVDILLMNDITFRADSSTSQIRFATNQFVHISRWKSGNNITYSCSCKMFSMAGRGMETSADNNYCCHTRFFSDYVSPMLSTLFNQRASDSTETALVQKLRHSVVSANNKVVRADCHSQFHRFSVISSDMRSCAIVHLHNNKFCCQSGKCRAAKGSMRSQKSLAKSSCEHLQAISDNCELWQDLVTPDLGENCPSDEDVLMPEFVDDNEEDDSSQHFDAATGLWNFESISTHKPLEMENPVLKKAIKERTAITFCNPGVCISDDGYFLKKMDNTSSEPFPLFPQLDKERVCQCGERYWNASNPDGILVKRYSKPTTVYLMHGVAKFYVYDRQCVLEKDECRIQYSGQQDGIHIVTRDTAAGDEIGHDFINCVTNSQMSLSGYCTIFGSRYTSTPLTFMSRQTFTKWIFSWMANFKIDFRSCCSYCGHNPKILACDGTKLGMYFKNTSLDAFESPTIQEKIHPSHKASERQFFCYSTDLNPVVKEQKRQARRDLHYFVLKNTNCLSEWKKSKHAECESDRSEGDRISNILEHCPDWSRNVTSKYLNRNYDQNLISTLSVLYRVFVTDSPLTSLINYRFVDYLQTYVREGLEIDDELIRVELPEISNLIHVSNLSSEFEDIKDFLLGMTNKILMTHRNDRATETPTVKESYNPERQGRAYYFTDHGARVRDMAIYEVAKKSNENSSCRKAFIEVAKSGVTYLFLWFDPIHGHCYGFHIITSCEGRKDPFASALMYMESAPSEIFYDFSCQLEEYCLNREPGFFRETRFFHDIFHGFTHKCEYVYNSRRISSLDVGLNTEICEQFNSFIQKIKYSARAMNQSHFTFFLQFFIHIWNQQKKRVFESEQNLVQSFFSI